MPAPAPRSSRLLRQQALHGALDGDVHDAPLTVNPAIAVQATLLRLAAAHDVGLAERPLINDSDLALTDGAGGRRRRLDGPAPDQQRDAGQDPDGKRDDRHDADHDRLAAGDLIGLLEKGLAHGGLYLTDCAK